MQDFLSKSDRSIRNIPVPSSRRQAPPPARTRRRSEGEGAGRRLFNLSTLWILVGAVLAVLLALVVASFFDGAKVTVYPRTQTVTIDKVVLASTDAPVGQLPYQIMKTERNVDRTLAATGEAKVERRASGIITIYNEFSTASQRLIKNTRFEAPDGKVYRINDSITVPGATKRADGTLSAGTIDVTVYADSPGETYNKAPTQFTIPGFKGDPRYTKFYARSKTALSGGFVGVERVVSEAEFSRALDEMKKELGDTLTEGLTGELPEGYLLIGGGTLFSFDEPVRENSGSDVRVTLTGVISSPIVRERDLASSIAKITVADYDGEAVLFKDISALTISTGGPETPTSSSLKVSLSGNPELVWQFDGEALRGDLAGKEKAAFEGILKTYEPEIARAYASIRPFFKGTFPEIPSEIDIVLGKSD